MTAAVHPVDYRCPRCGFTYTDPGRARVISIAHTCKPTDRQATRLQPIPVHHQGEPATQKTPRRH